MDDRKRSCSIAFTGDIGFDKFMAGKWTDEELLSDGILEFLNSSDHVVANVEAAMVAVTDNKPRSQFFHAMDPEARHILRKMNADIWNIGNNHIMDAGLEGIVSTKKITSEMGVRTVGAGLNEEDASTPVYLDEAGGIGLLGVAFQRGCKPATETDPGNFRWDNMEYIEKRIKEIKSKCRWCVIVSHGSEEFAALPNPYVRNRYLKYLDMGADAVISHHPHVPENYETFDNGKMIFYSLGNFIFDTPYQRAHKYTDMGVLVRLNFTENEMKFEAAGTRLNRSAERIDIGPLPGIFADIRQEEYDLLLPLASKVFLKEEQRKMVYWKPEEYANATPEQWDAYFHSDKTDGYVKDNYMDLSLVVPYAEKASDESWKKSKLEAVKEYLLQLE